MRREEGSTPLEHSAPIGLESVGGVVERNSKQSANKEIGQSIQTEFQPGIIDRAAMLHETAAEDAVPPLIQHLPVANHVAAIVRFIGHHDNDCVAPTCIDPLNDGPPEAEGR